MLTQDCTAVRNTECAVKPRIHKRIYNSYSRTCRRLRQNRSLEAAVSFCGFQLRGGSTVSSENKRGKSFPEILARCRSRAIVGNEICIECNNLSKPGNAARRSRSMHLD